MENNDNITAQNLYLSVPDVDYVIEVTNNRAQYYSDLAKKYKDEAKEYKDLAQSYAEQNSDVTLEYVNEIKDNLQSQINTKQLLGDYALNSDIPTNVSELENDSQYITKDVNNLANYLPLTGGTINGNLIMGDGDKRLRFINGSFPNAVGTAPELSQYLSRIQFNVTNNEWLSCIQLALNSNNEQVFEFNQRRKNIEGNYVLAALQSRINTQGEASLYFCNKKMRYVTDTYRNGTSWWRLYNDGWCEQGGYLAGSGTQTISFLKSFKDTNYSLTFGMCCMYNGNLIASASGCHSYTQSGFTFFADGNTNKFWEAKGYI